MGVTARDVADLARPSIDLEEPEAWCSSMQRGAQRLADHYVATGDQALARRWHSVAQALNESLLYLDRVQAPSRSKRQSAAIPPDPFSEPTEHDNPIPQHGSSPAEVEAD